MKTVEELQKENAALVAQVESKEFERIAAITQATNMFDALKMAIAAFDKYEMSVDSYPTVEHVKMRERLYNSAFKNADYHLRELRAETVLDAVNEHEKKYGNSHFGRHLREYAASIMKGSAP